MPCVYMTPSASSTLLNGFTLTKKFHAHQTITVSINPTKMAPQPLTQPAHGVIPTNPQIIPLTPPRKVGCFALENKPSIPIQARTPTAVAIFVLTTAADMSMPA